MNTTAAATEAQVTVATIRNWCRHGVIAATKRAGRWIIDTASLAHRIAIAAMKRTREEPTPVINLTASYTYTSYVGDTQVPVTVTPKVRHSTDYDGNPMTSISRLAPLFADRFDAITDEGDRIHCLELFRTARIVIASTPDEDTDDDSQARDGGRLRTTYRGNIPGITVDDVLDLAEQLRTQLAA